MLRTVRTACLAATQTRPDPAKIQAAAKAVRKLLRERGITAAEWS